MERTLTDNEERAERGRQALLPYLQDQDGDLREALTDLLTDLYHWIGYADTNPGPLSDILDVAFDHFLEEKEEALQ